MRRRRHNARRRRHNPAIHRPRLWKSGGLWHHAKGPGALFSGRVSINPRRRRRRGFRFNEPGPIFVRYSRKGRRHNPRRRSYRHNPFRRHRRHYRHNPFNLKGGLRRMVSRQWLVTIGSFGGGMVAGMAVKTLLVSTMKSQPMLANQTKFVGVGNMIVGSLMFGMMRNRMLKSLGLGIAATGLYDVLAQNVAMLKLPELPAWGLIGGSVGSSYPVSYVPVSSVAAGVGASYPGNAPAGYGASYEAPGMSTAGFSGGLDNPYADVFAD